MIETLLFFRESVFATLVIAVGCSMLGVYVVLRRIVFVGAALAQLSSAGIAAALLLGGLGVGLGLFASPLFLALVFASAGVAFFALQDGRHWLPADAALGAVFVVAGATAVLFVASSATADIYDLFFGGDVLLISRQELFWLTGVTVPTLIVHLLLYKEFVFISYDPEMAAASGYHVRGWNLLLYLTIGAIITVAIRSVGVLLVFALLVLPGITGLALGSRMPHVFVWAVVAGSAGAVLGFVVSIGLDLPSGPSIVVVLGLLSLLAWGARSFRDGRA